MAVSHLLWYPGSACVFVYLFVFFANGPNARVNAGDNTQQIQIWLGMSQGRIFCDPLNTFDKFNARGRLPTPENLNAWVWHDRASGYLGAYQRGGPKRRNSLGSVSVVAESVVISSEAYGVSLGFTTFDLWWPKVSYFTWEPKRGGRKCRILPGSLSMVAESVMIYLGA